MIIKSKYKVARRLGAPIFEKTQTAKYALRLERSGKEAWRPKSEFGKSMLEKQKARFTYRVNERQFSNYVHKANEVKKSTPVQALYESLELRLDNIIYRLGIASTRGAARQMVSHGHIYINGKRVAVPSYRVDKKDIIAIRPGSVKKPLFATLDEKMKEVKVPEWLSYDAEKREAKVVGVPTYSPRDNQFDLKVVLEFYSR